MGLDLYGVKSEHIGRVGSYSAFNEFREMLENYIVCIEEEDEDKDYSTLFSVLLNHSDCDGILNFDESLELLKDIEKHKERIIKFCKENYTEDLKEFFIDTLDLFEESCESVKNEVYDYIEFG